MFNSSTKLALLAATFLLVGGHVSANPISTIHQCRAAVESFCAAGNPGQANECIAAVRQEDPCSEHYGMDLVTFLELERTPNQVRPTLAVIVRMEAGDEDHDEPASQSPSTGPDTGTVPTR